MEQQEKIKDRLTEYQRRDMKSRSYLDFVRFEYEKSELVHQLVLPLLDTETIGQEARSGYYSSKFRLQLGLSLAKLAKVPDRQISAALADVADKFFLAAKDADGLGAREEIYNLLGAKEDWQRIYASFLLSLKLICRDERKIIIFQ